MEDCKRLHKGDEPPPMVERVVNLARSGGRIIGAALRGEDILAPDVTKSHRLAICKTCALYNPENGVCGACGCIMRVKAGLAVEECPLGEWEKLV